MTMKEMINKYQSSIIPKDSKFIFGYLFNKYASDMQSIGINTADEAKMLDTEYIYNESGCKELTGIFDYLLSQYTFTETMQKMADIVYQRFFENWKRKYDAFFSDYDPIENYNRVEIEKIDSKIDTNQSNSIYAFNSTTSPTPTDKQDGSTSGTNANNVRDLRVSGNIGVTTSQQMIESSLNLYKQNLFDLMFRDIDSIMCLSIY